VLPSNTAKIRANKLKPSRSSPHAGDAVPPGFKGKVFRGAVMTIGRLQVVAVR
jgi:hypothetical protein